MNRYISCSHHLHINNKLYCIVPFAINIEKCPMLLQNLRFAFLCLTLSVPRAAQHVHMWRIADAISMPVAGHITESLAVNPSGCRVCHVIIMSKTSHGDLKKEQALQSVIQFVPTHLSIRFKWQSKVSTPNVTFPLFSIHLLYC